MSRQGRVLAVGGSDSGAGAGIQADIKTTMALGGYCCTAITAITAQNTLGVQAVQMVPASFVALQMRSVLQDIGADAVKTGMLGDADVIASVCEVLSAYPSLPLVVDTVMVAKGGHSLLQAAAVETLRTMLAPRATLLTPNVPEAELLLGTPIRTLDDQARAADALLATGAAAILLKGGHREGDQVTDILARPEGQRRFTAPRIDTRHTHGTGCTLASGIATGLAQGLALDEAIIRALRYVQAAMRAAPCLGAGHGPMDHAAIAR